jgi:hypothetical protein
MKMRIRVPVTQTRYGYVELDVDDSLFATDGTDSRKRRIAAKSLAEAACAQGEDAITWTDNAHDIEISCGYQEVADTDANG